MNVVAKIRRGDGPLWGSVKHAARTLLSWHLPAHGWLRPLFRGLYALHVTLRETCSWCCRFAWYEPLFRSQCEAVGDGLRMERLPYMVGSGRILVGHQVQFSGKPSICFGNATETPPCLRIGDHSFIGHNTSLIVAKSIEIGHHCLIAGNVTIRDFDGHPLDAIERREHRRVHPEDIHPVRIGDDVWIGSGAVILKGVCIGARSVVAAGAMVTKDVPADVVVAGNPARIVKQLNQPDAS